jgi:putative oxidoreductase
MLADLLQLTTHGLNLPDIGTGLMRAGIGTFFAISGYRKLFDAEGHARLLRVLTKDGIPYPTLMVWWVAGWEFLGGAALAAGLFSAFMATVLLIICLVACATDAIKKIPSVHEIGVARLYNSYLYLPEVLYCFALVTVILGGPGMFSLDHLFF